MAELDPKDACFAKLEAHVAARDALIVELMAKVEALTARVAELEARLSQNSSNSSKPPSSDVLGTPRPPKKPTGRRPGGQPGHKKHEPRLLPPEAVRHFVELVPKECKGCRGRLVGRDSEPCRHQVVDVPPLSAIVIEYRSHALESRACGTVTRQPVPAHASSAFGDRLGALASLLVGKYRLSKRLVKDALSDMVGVELSVGSVVNLEALKSVCGRLSTCRAWSRRTTSASGVCVAPSCTGRHPSARTAPRAVVSWSESSRPSPRSICNGAAPWTS